MTTVSDLIRPVTIQCPYCWESFEVTVDCSAGDQEYIEDCEVCCQPIEFRLYADAECNLLELETDRAQ